MLSVAEAVILEFQTQDGFDVFRLTRGNEGHRDDPVMESVAELLEALPVLLQCDVVLAVVGHFLHNVQPQDWVFVELSCAWLAAILLHEAPARNVQCDAGV